MKQKSIKIEEAIDLSKKLLSYGMVYDYIYFVLVFDGLVHKQAITVLNWAKQSLKPVEESC